jgi:transcriptional regulator with PAS, ATPase and Fis domain
LPGEITLPLDDFPSLVGHHPLILKIEALIRKLSATNATALVVGESGTGKELVAHAIHAHSLVANHAFIPVNCGAVPAELLESELFGHERGAFTGAIGARAGMFQIANGGTIFLDEVGEMSSALQVKLLRVLQDGEVRPVGADRAMKVNVRVIAATSKDLAEEMKHKAFREDLFYRLNVIPIVMPPLRERRSDIPMLINHFLAKQNRKRPEHAPVQFGAEVVVLLEEYDWPGNVRELENIIERMVILSEEDVMIVVEDLPSNIQEFVSEKRFPKPTVSEKGLDFNGAMELYENRLIDEALGRTHGNKQAAARLLGLKRTTLVAKLSRRVVDTIVEPGQKYLL